MAKSVLENSPELSPLNPEDEGKRKKRSPAEPVGAEMTAQAVAERAQALAEWNQQRSGLAMEARREVESDVDALSDDEYETLDPTVYAAEKAVKELADRLLMSPPDGTPALAKAEAPRAEKTPNKMSDDVARSLAELSALENEWARKEKLTKHAQENERRLAQARAAFAVADAEEKARKAQEKAWKQEALKPAPVTPPMTDTERLIERQMRTALDEQAQGETQSGEIYDNLNAMLKESRAYRASEPERQERWAKEKLDAARMAIADAEVEASLPGKRPNREEKLLKKLDTMFQGAKPKDLEVLANEHPEWMENQGLWMNQQATKLRSERNTVELQLKNRDLDVFERGELEDELDAIAERELKLQAQFDALQVAYSVLGKEPSSLPRLTESRSSSGSVGFGSPVDKGFARVREYDRPAAEGPWMQYSNLSRKDREALADQLVGMAKGGVLSQEHAMELVERPLEQLSQAEAHTLAKAAQRLSESARSKDKTRFAAMADAIEALVDHNLRQSLDKAAQENPKKVHKLHEATSAQIDRMLDAMSRGEFIDANGRYLPTEINQHFDNFIHPDTRKSLVSDSALAGKISQQRKRFLDLQDSMNTDGKAIAKAFIADQEKPREVRAEAPGIEEGLVHVGRRPRTPKPFSKAESPEAADAEAVKKLYGQEVWLKRSTGETVRAVVGVPTEDGRTWMSYMINERQMGRKAVRNSEILAWQREMEGQSPDHAPEIPDSAFGDLLAEKPAPAPKFNDLTSKLPAPERSVQAAPAAQEAAPAGPRVPYTEIAPQIAELERELVEAKNTLDALNARLAQAKSGRSRESVTEIETDRAFWQEELRRTTDKLDDAEDDVAEAFTEEFSAQSEMLAERYGFPAEQIEDAAMDAQRTEAMVKRMVAAENAKTKGFFGRIANFFTSGSREKELTRKFHDMNAIAVRAGDAKQRMKELNDYRGRLK